MQERGWISLPDLTSQNLAVLSRLAVIARRPSRVMAMARTGFV